MELKRAMRTGLALLSFCVLGAVSPVTASQDATRPSVERHYCTQHGPFFIRFDDAKAAGVFAILSNGDLGSMVGQLNGTTLEGDWFEVGSRGRIVIEFSSDFTRFEAEYNVADAPETWYRGWLGVERPDESVSSIAPDDVLLHCG